MKSSSNISLSLPFFKTKYCKVSAWMAYLEELGNGYIATAILTVRYSWDQPCFRFYSSDSVRVSLLVSEREWNSGLNCSDYVCAYKHQRGDELSPELFSFAMRMTVHLYFLVLSISSSEHFFDFQYAIGFGKVFEWTLTISISFKVYHFGHPQVELDEITNNFLI